MPTPARGAYAIRMPPTETPQGARAERGFTQTRGHSREAHESGSSPVTRGDGGVFRLIRDNAPISLIARCPYAEVPAGRAEVLVLAAALVPSAGKHAIPDWKGPPPCASRFFAVLSSASSCSAEADLSALFMGLHQSGLMSELDNLLPFLGFVEHEFSKVGGCHQYWIGA